MAKPMKVMADIMEKKHNCKIEIRQGGSQDLYNTLKSQKDADLYLPGSDSYVKNNLKDGLLLNNAYVGYNQASIFVQKGNPKKIKDLNDFTREDLKIMLVNPTSGSIGRASKKILVKYNGEDFYNDIFDLTVDVGTDSKNLNSKFKNNEIDATINWNATAFFKENLPYMDVVKIDKKFAKKKKLLLNLVVHSKNKEIAKDFIKFASSKEGNKIMKEYGFLD